MEFSYDKIADVLYIKLNHETVKNTEEIGEGTIIDYSENNVVIGVEILNYSQRNINLNKLVLLNAEELIPTIVQCR